MTCPKLVPVLRESGTWKPGAPLRRPRGRSTLDGDVNGGDLPWRSRRPVASPLDSTGVPAFPTKCGSNPALLQHSCKRWTSISSTQEDALGGMRVTTTRACAPGEGTRCVRPPTAARSHACRCAGGGRWKRPWPGFGPGPGQPMSWRRGRPWSGAGGCGNATTPDIERIA